MPAQEAGFLPALRFHSLTPVFDGVAALTVRDRALKRRVLAQAAVAEGDDVLDVGCGTGTLAVAAKQATPRARLTGLDADPAILARARRKAEAAGAEISFDQGMANALPYGDDSFDVAVSTLFFHHLPDEVKHETAAELTRVLRPGGRLVVGDFGRPHDPLMRAAVLTVQVFDGFPRTSLNIRGGLPDVLAGAGFERVAVADRMRTPIGTVAIVTATAA